MGTLAANVPANPARTCRSTREDRRAFFSSSSKGTPFAETRTYYSDILPHTV